MTESRPQSLPAFAKGARRTTEVALVGWIDLLGYRGQISRYQYNPLDPSAARAIERVQQFHEVVAAHSHRFFPTFVMNDGAVVYRDASPRTGSVTADFLARAWRMFEEISALEKRHGEPGARMILAAGFRARRATAFNRPSSHAQSLLKRLAEGKITGERAVVEALHAHRYFDIVPDLQTNFALTKAYLADVGGRSMGLPGPGCYIEEAVLPDPLPQWLECGPPIAWRTESGDIQTAYRQLKTVHDGRGEIDRPAQGMDAVAIATRMTGDNKIQSKLHEARVRKLSGSSIDARFGRT